MKQNRLQNIKQYTQRLMLTAAAIGFIVLMFSDLTHFVLAGRRGLLLFAQNIMPVLFPFFFISSLLAGLGIFSACAPLLNKPMGALYKTGGSTGGVFLVSLLSGYPTGARLLSELYERREISRTDAVKTATWTSTCSPAFVVGSVGTALYNSPAIGAVLFAAHTLGALFNGLLYRKIRFNEALQAPNLRRVQQKTQIQQNIRPTDEVLNTALCSAVQSILTVGGWVVLFYVAAAQLQEAASLPPAADIAVSSFLEMAAGVFRAGNSASPVLICAIISFGGLSVAMQAQTYFKTFKMPMSFYFLYKTTHTVIAVLLCAGMLLFI